MTSPDSPFAGARMRHFANRDAAAGDEYPDRLRRHFSLAATAEAMREISAWQGYRPTPLIELPAVAAEFGLGAVYYKDESARFGLGSFKALGGAFAVLRVLQQLVLEAAGARATAGDLERGRFRAVTARATVVTATDGNHGRAVAWGAARFNCNCRIFIHAGVSANRARALGEFGAEVTRIRGDYDESVRRAAADADAGGRYLVSDTSWPGYVETPAAVMAGYSVMCEEIAAQAPGVLASPESGLPRPRSVKRAQGAAALPSDLPGAGPGAGPTPPGPATHVFVQGGVGGLAAAVAAYLWEKCGARRPRFVVVEPELAACLLQSAVSGRAGAVDITEETLMAGLSCGEASALAWQVLGRGADDFVTIPDDLVAPAMRLLARGKPPVEAGESAVAGLAGCLAARASPPIAAALGLDSESRVLVFGTEGATDREIYRKLVGGI